MALPEMLTDPVPLAILTLIIAAVVHYQRGLTWTEYRAIQGLKRRWFPLFDRYWPKFVHHKKHFRDNDEYLETRNQSVRSVWKQLVSEGASPHVVASLKRRQPPASPTQFSAAHVAWMHDDGTQTEAYLFDNGDGTCDLYAHTETSVVDAEDHLSDPQTDGDARGVVQDALEERE